MTPTKEQKAQEYAEKKVQEIQPASCRRDKQIYDADDIEYCFAEAYKDGYTACEQSMWRNVEEELPELGENQCAVIRTKRDGKFKVAYFDRQCRVFDVKVGSNSCEIYRLCEITHILPIPLLPATNPEKK